MKKIIIMLCAAFAAISCSTTGNSSASASLNGEWNIVKVGGNTVNPAPEFEKPFIGFKTAGKKVYGNISCNSIMGTYSTGSNGGITFGQMATTRMMCHDSRTEDLILDALNKSKKVAVNGTEMILSDAGGKELMTLKRK